MTINKSFWNSYNARGSILSTLHVLSYSSENGLKRYYQPNLRDAESWDFEKLKNTPKVTYGKKAEVEGKVQNQAKEEEKKMQQF